MSVVVTMHACSYVTCAAFHLLTTLSFAGSGQQGLKMSFTDLAKAASGEAGNLNRQVQAQPAASAAPVKAVALDELEKQLVKATPVSDAVADAKLARAAAGLPAPSGKLGGYRCICECPYNPAKHVLLSCIVVRGAFSMF